MGASSSTTNDEPPPAPEVWGTDRGLQSTLPQSVGELDDALMEAVADGDSEATASLLAEGANVNHLSAELDWASPTIVAAQEGSLDCLKLLLAVPHVQADRADKFGFTACHTAAHWCRLTLSTSAPACVLTDCAACRAVQGPSGLPARAAPGGRGCGAPSQGPGHGGAHSGRARQRGEPAGAAHARRESRRGRCGGAHGLRRGRREWQRAVRSHAGRVGRHA